MQENTLEKNSSEKSANSAAQATDTGSDNLLAQDIIDYLEEHPEFFVDNAELLATMRVPHASGGNAISLIERQVEVLREQNAKLKTHLQELITIAKDNELANQRMHKLILALLDAQSLEDIYEVLDKLLCSEFSADAVAIKLFNQPLEGEHSGLFMTDEEQIQAVNKLTPTLSPQCGNFRQQEMTLFFADNADKAASAALVPLAVDKDNRLGLLAIGSENVRRFNAEMGTMFLERLGETISHVVKRFF